MLGPRFGPCYLQSSILIFLAPFCKDLPCQTQIGLCFSNFFIKICGQTQSWTKATEAAHAYANNRGWNSWGEPAPPICSSIGRTQPPPSENEGTNPSKIPVKSHHRFQHRPKDYLLKGSVWECVRDPNLDQLFSITSVCVFFCKYLWCQTRMDLIFGRYCMALRCQSTIMVIAPNNIQRSHRLELDPELIFSRKYAFSCFNCGCLNKTVGSWVASWVVGLDVLLMIGAWRHCSRNAFGLGIWMGRLFRNLGFE